jgi:hypothetical protein
LWAWKWKCDHRDRVEWKIIRYSYRSGMNPLGIIEQPSIQAIPIAMDPPLTLGVLESLLQTSIV